MRSAVRKMGNSSGVIIPKPMLTELGIRAGDSIEMIVLEGRLVIEAVTAHPRAGWAAAARQIAESGDAALVLGEFGNDGDDLLSW